MALTFPRSLPNLDDIQQISVRKTSIVGVSQGMFSLNQQVQKHSGQRWEVEYTIVPLNRADMDEWWAWIISMNGREKTFYGVLQAPNEIKGTAKNYAGPLVSGAHAARAGSLSIYTAPTEVTGYLKAGDIFQIGSVSADARLYMCLEDVTTDDYGEATFDIWPDLYSALPNAEAITVAAPVGVFRMQENSAEILIDNTSTRKGLRFSAIGVV